MKSARQIWRMTWWASAVLLVFFINLPRTARAHGELLIRIAAATQQIEAANTNLAQLYLNRAELYREDRNWTNAEADYVRAAQIDPKLDVVDFCRAQMLSDSSQLEASRALFDKVLARSPENGEAFINRARVLVKLNQPKSAVADFRRGLTLLPEPKAEYFLELAQVLVAGSKTNDALRSLDAGMKKLGPVVTLQSYTMELELGQKNIDAALSRLDTIIEGAERKENWFARRGDILLAAGRLAEAEKAFESALAAIKRLPLVLQKAPPMQNLQSHIHLVLAKSLTTNNDKNSFLEISH